MINRFKRFTAIALTTTLLIVAAPKRVKANPAIAAPAACATGVGCVFLGIVIIGGISYYAWRHSQTGQQWNMPIEDPEEEAERMGNPQSESVEAIDYTEAQQACEENAYGRTLIDVRFLGGNQWECIYI